MNTSKKSTIVDTTDKLMQIGKFQSFPCQIKKADLPTAFFVPHPSRIEETKRLHLVRAQKPYTIENTIVLSKIEYENFISDLQVYRHFIEKNAHLMLLDEEGIYHCIFVRQRNRKDGALVSYCPKTSCRYVSYYSARKA